MRSDVFRSIQMYFNSVSNSDFGLRLFICFIHICTLSTAFNTKKHTKMRKKVENRVLQCYLCKLIVKNKVSNLRRHIKLHGPKVECIKCLECNATFQSKSNFKTHWARKHNDVADVKMQVGSRKSNRT